jgi:tRNA(fMet)-specific endonuclease VapC
VAAAPPRVHEGSGGAGLWPGADRERQGTPIGVNDLHISAHARTEGLTLVSNNLREFQRVEGLLLENWAI